MDPHSSSDEHYGREGRASNPSEGEWVAETPDLSPADLVAVASDLVETQLRTRPIPTLLVAVAAGWLVGRILR